MKKWKLEWLSFIGWLRMKSRKIAAIFIFLEMTLVIFQIISGVFRAVAPSLIFAMFFIIQDIDITGGLNLVILMGFLGGLFIEMRIPNLIRSWINGYKRKNIFWALRTGLSIRSMVNNSGINDFKLHIYDDGEYQSLGSYIKDSDKEVEDRYK